MLFCTGVFANSTAVDEGMIEWNFSLFAVMSASERAEGTLDSAASEIAQAKEC